MPTPTTATHTGRRRLNLGEIHTAATALLNLGTISVQREIHNALAAGNITPAELHLLQSEWNGVQDHLESFLDTLSSLRNAIEHQARMDSLAFAHDGVRNRDNHPDNHDRDAGLVCASCQHDLEQDADFRCVRCGTPS